MGKHRRIKEGYHEPPREGSDFTKLRILIKPRSAAQASYLDSLEKYTMTFGIGPAGTGKTYLAIATALKALNARKIDRIIITRPVVESGEQLGFLPGDIAEKMDPYIKPITDAIVEFVGGKSAKMLFDNGTIEICPLAYMRGRTFKNSFIIADEMSSATPSQMKNLLTRIGEGSTMAILGDPKQSDLPKGAPNGLSDIISCFDRYGKKPDGMRMVHMSANDIVRHPLLKTILAIYGEVDESELESNEVANLGTMPKAWDEPVYHGARLKK